MRTVMRIGLALLMALAVSTSATAQTNMSPISLNALVGPSFANVGITFATAGDISIRLTDRLSLAGEAGILPRTSYEQASEIAPVAPFSDTESLRVNAYHLNANVKVQPVAVNSLAPYLTAGVGTFTTDTVTNPRRVDGVWVSDSRRATDFATNIGGGISYRVHDWMGLCADYRMFFVHRNQHTPHVHRLVTGLSLFVK